MLALVAKGGIGPGFDNDLPVFFVEFFLELLIGLGVRVTVGEPRVVLEVCITYPISPYTTKNLMEDKTL